MDAKSLGNFRTASLFMVSNVKGVYIIGTTGTTYYVGQGDIADCIRAHRNDPEFNIVPSSAKVRYIKISSDVSRVRQERHLIRELRPRLNKRL